MRSVWPGPSGRRSGGPNDWLQPGERMGSNHSRKSVAKRSEVRLGLSTAMKVRQSKFYFNDGWILRRLSEIRSIILIKMSAVFYFKTFL